MHNPAFTLTPRQHPAPTRMAFARPYEFWQRQPWVNHSVTRRGTMPLWDTQGRGIESNYPILWLSPAQSRVSSTAVSLVHRSSSANPALVTEVGSSAPALLSVRPCLHPHSSTRVQSFGEISYLRTRLRKSVTRNIPRDFCNSAEKPRGLGKFRHSPHWQWALTRPSHR